MFKSKAFSLLKYNKFTFGDRTISQFVVFECKYLLSIIIFYFHKTEKEQDRFHTHAFNALSIKLWGSYDEHVLEDEVTGKYRTDKRTQIFKYFPRDSFHKIGKGNGCCTILISGPWNRKWKERLDTGEIVEYNWNRKLAK